ncbi:MAG: nuclear transport factor 2 family protein [Pseudomonadota bacterium]
MHAKLLTVLIFFGLVPVSAATVDHAAEHKAAIEAAVFDYFHGQGEASAERLNRAFAAEFATMVGVTRDAQGNESIRAWKDMTEVLANWSANENPPGTERDGEILSMDIVDDRIAVVLFRSADRFYDALTLVHIEDEWRIVQKAFVLQ